MRYWIWRAVLVAALTAAFDARAAEIRLSCGSQELEFRLCEERALLLGIVALLEAARDRHAHESASK